MASFINITTNVSNASYPQQYMACDSLDTSFPVKIAELFPFSIIMLFGVVGNALIMILVYKRPELRTMMNYFIINMAASDFVFALTATPILMVEIATSSWQWYIDSTVGLIICKLSLFMKRVSIAVSVQSLIWIALDRFVVVVFPLEVHLISSRIRALAIASTWIVAIGMKTLDLYTLELVEIGDRVICTQDFDTTEFSYRDYARVYTALFHVVPLLLKTILYSIIAATLRGQNKALRRKEVHQRSRRKEGAIRMSFCIVAAFNICVLPLISFYILLEYDIKISCSLYKAVWILAHVLFHSSTTTNPIIYITFVRSYRCGLREILSSCNSAQSPASNQRGREDRGAITLQEIKVIPGTRENLAFSET